MTSQSYKLGEAPTEAHADRTKAVTTVHMNRLCTEWSTADRQGNQCSWQTNRLTDALTGVPSVSGRLLASLFALPRLASWLSPYLVEVIAVLRKHRALATLTSIDKQPNRETNTQTNRQTNKHTQTHKQTNNQTNNQAIKQATQTHSKSIRHT